MSGTAIRLHGWEPCDLKSKAYLAWGQLVKLAAPVLTMHHSDLAHDLDILRAYADGVKEVWFFWSVDSAGTCIYRYNLNDTSDRRDALQLARSRTNVYDCHYYWEPTPADDGVYWLHIYPLEPKGSN